MKKNVLIIHTDQQRYDSLGCTNNKFAVTPNIDKFAVQATIFDRHIVANPVCMPSRASLLTGLYPPGHNVHTNGVALNRKGYTSIDDTFGLGNILPEPLTMADMFANAGYSTASFGKLHLTPNVSPKEYGYQECWQLLKDGSLDNWHGPYYGFQQVEMTMGHGEQPCIGGHYGAWLKKNHPDLFKQVQENEKNPPRVIPGMGNLYPSPVPAKLHNSAWLAGRFCSYLAERSDEDKPFFAFVGFPDPHHPFNPSFDVLEKFKDIEVQTPCDAEGKALVTSPFLSDFFKQRGIPELNEEERKTILRYTHALVNQIDTAVGTILDFIDKAGLQDDTIIVFTSDHGDFMLDHKLLYKGTIGSDALLHVPFIMRVPGEKLPARIKTPMSNCDVLPTLAALTGIEIPENLHGINILDAIKNRQQHYALAFATSYDPGTMNYTIYDKSHRLSWNPDNNAVELYNHEIDPGEVCNIADNQDKQKLVKTLIQEIKDCLIKYHNPILGRVGAW